MNKIKIGIFVEGTFLPSFEGATQRFVSLADNLSISDFEVTIFHCYRGWSDKNIIKEQNYTTYFIPPDIFYNNIPTIERIIKLEKLEVIVMSNYEMIMQIGYPIKCRMEDIKLIFEVHDISYDYNKSFNPTSEKNEMEKRFEYLAFKISDLCFCFNNYDKERIFEILKEFNDDGHDVLNRVIVMPFGVTHNGTNYVGVNLSSRTVLFLGNMYHTPNTIALKDIYYKIMPKVREKDSSIIFLMAGDTPDFLINECRDRQIKYLGKVKDLETVFRQTSLAISPIFYGSGIKVKVLEYCQAGMAILCSSQSLRGIINSGEDKLDFEIEDSIDNYASRILEVLNRPDRLVEMSRSMKKYVERQSWNVITDLFISVISNSKRKRNFRISGRDVKSLKNLNPYFLEYYNRLKRFENIQIDKIFKGGFGHFTELSPV